MAFVDLCRQLATIHFRCNFAGDEFLLSEIAGLVLPFGSGTVQLDFQDDNLLTF
jgi:hypothetical protein